jgi:hypothetical protein
VLDEYILPTERRVIRARLHPVAIVHKVLLAVVLFVLLALGATLLPGNALLDNVLWYGALAVLLTASIQTGEWWVEKVVVTDKRVMRMRGLLTHHVDMMPLTKVTDLTFQRTLLGRLLGYGSLHIESAGQVQGLELLSFLPEPEEVYGAVSELVFGGKRQTRTYLSRGPRTGARSRRR